MLSTTIRVRSAKLKIRLSRAARLAPEAAIASNPAWAANAVATADIPVATADDIDWADAAILRRPGVHSVYHFGGIIVPPGYTDPVKHVDGNPYDTSHVDGQGPGPLDETTVNAARYQTRRVVETARVLKTARAA